MKKVKIFYSFILVGWLTQLIVIIDNWINSYTNSYQKSLFGNNNLNDLSQLLIFIGYVGGLVSGVFALMGLKRIKNNTKANKLFIITSIVYGLLVVATISFVVWWIVQLSQPLAPF